MTHLPVLGVPVQSQALSGRTACSRSSRCPRACRWARWPSARRARPMPGCSPRAFWHHRRGADRAAQGLARSAQRRRGGTAAGLNAETGQHDRHSRRGTAWPHARHRARAAGLSLHRLRARGRQCRRRVCAEFFTARWDDTAALAAFRRAMRCDHLGVRERARSTARHAGRSRCSRRARRSRSRRTG